MFGKLEIFRMASAMAKHAGTRQAAIAQNVANADTPGFKARDIASFSDIMSRRRDVTGQFATRPGHLNGTLDPAQPEFRIVEAAADSPNGNSVSIEDEMMKSVDTQRQHERSIAIYRSSLNILRTSLGRS